MSFNTTIITLILTLATVVSHAEELHPQASSRPTPVSLGIGVAKPSEALYSQLPNLPRGSGFFLKSVTPGGAASLAGLNEMDLIWKLDDQILINEGQLLVILSLYQTGDSVKISYFRSGQPLTTAVRLQPAGKIPAHPESLVMTPPLPGLPNQPMRVISYEDRSASISDKTGTATLAYRKGKLWLHVQSNKGEETFNGTISNPKELARVPALWRNRLPILRSSLEESIRLRRLPRIRRVPTPRQHIAESE